MKKQVVVGTIGLFIVAIGISIYLSTRKAKLLSVIEQLPTAKLHEHIASDGTIVEHRHTFEEPELSESVVKLIPTSEATHPIQRAWEALDLAAIKRKYQPYTIAEMREIWDGKYRQHCGPFGNFPPGESPVEKADSIYPRDEWLKRSLDLGRPFVTFSDYRNTLGSREGFIRQREKWEAEGEFVPYSRNERITALQLPPDTTWEEYIDVSLKFTIVGRVNILRAKEADPSIQGGTTSLEGTFLPFKENTVHVHISPETGLSKFIGANLTQAEKNDLTKYGIAPKGVTVIYVDENEKPLPPDTSPPTFYEQRMKALEEAQTFLQQQIEEHEALLDIDALLNPPEEKKQVVTVPHEHTLDHNHTHETPQVPEALPSQQRQHPDTKQPPPQRRMPPELRTPDMVNQWFKELELLHGGKLPKDLQELRKIITELEKIRKEGEAMMKPSQRPERPTPPLPPDAIPSPPPNEDD